MVTFTFPLTFLGYYLSKQKQEPSQKLLHINYLPKNVGIMKIVYDHWKNFGKHVKGNEQKQTSRDTGGNPAERLISYFIFPLLLKGNITWKHNFSDLFIVFYEIFLNLY